MISSRLHLGCCSVHRLGHVDLVIKGSVELSPTSTSRVAESWDPPLHHLIICSGAISAFPQVFFYGAIDINSFIIIIFSFYSSY